MKNRGFTLIELLVVISIIGLLSSVVLASLSTARAKSQTVRRKLDMKQLQTALEIYYNDNNAYPSTANGWHGVSAYGGYGAVGAGAYIPNLAPTYISVLPIDPLGATACDGYLYNSDGVSYKLLSHACPNTYPSSGSVFYDPVRPTWALMLCSGQTACNTW